MPEVAAAAEAWVAAVTLAPTGALVVVVVMLANGILSMVTVPAAVAAP